jgi:hypothetical protein
MLTENVVSYISDLPEHIEYMLLQSKVDLFLEPLISEVCRYNFVSLHGVEPRRDEGTEK